MQEEHSQRCHEDSQVGGTQPRKVVVRMSPPGTFTEMSTDPVEILKVKQFI